jgi:hypothetical protein
MPLFAQDKNTIFEGYFPAIRQNYRHAKGLQSGSPFACLIYALILEIGGP